MATEPAASGLKTVPERQGAVEGKGIAELRKAKALTYQATHAQPLLQSRLRQLHGAIGIGSSTGHVALLAVH